MDGDTTEEVLRYVQYDPEQLRSQLRREGERAIRSGHLSVAQAGVLRQAVDAGLRGYTYLNPTAPLNTAPQEPAASRDGAAHHARHESGVTHV